MTISQQMKKEDDQMPAHKRKKKNLFHSEQLLVIRGHTAFAFYALGIKGLILTGRGLILSI